MPPSPEPTQGLPTSQKDGRPDDPSSSKETQLLVDDTNVYRVTIHRSDAGVLTTEPIDGVILIFNPGTGWLFLRIVHAGEWEGQKRLMRVARTGTAEEVISFIDRLDEGKRPGRVLVTRESMRDPLKRHMQDFAPNIAVELSRLGVAVKALLKVGKIADMIRNATEPRLVELNSYNDWLEYLGPRDALSRLALILQGFCVDPAKAQSIL